MATAREPIRALASDRGQSAVAVVMVVAVLVVVFTRAIAGLGAASVDRVRAQTAADAAALASVEGDRGDAVEFARRHGAELVSWERGPGRFEVTVVVRHGDATAVARATTAP